MTALAVEELVPGVWAAVRADHRALVAEGPGGVVCVGTHGPDTPALAAAIAARARGPVAALVYPLDHLDHAGGGGALAPAQVVAHELCARLVAARAAPGQLAVSRTVGGRGEELELAGLRVSLLHPGPSQGTGNLAVHLPEAGVLYVVGPRADARYGLFADVHVEHVARSWRALAGLGARIVAPGRGPLLGRDGLERARRYVEALQHAAQKAFATGVPVWSLPAVEEEALDRLQGEFGDLDGFREHVGLTALRFVHHYLMGGWGPEDTARPELLLER
jgi:cyclase